MTDAKSYPLVKGLIERLEKATGPDRELDELLFQLANGRKRNISTFEQYDPSEKLPAYTGSIDAALTLVPEGLRFSLVQMIGGGARAGIQKKGAMIHLSEAIGPTPATALCIAALKARETLGSQ